MTATGRRSKIALALAGGGPVGGIYEVGAMAALAEALEGVDFTTFDIYVGVSSGALLSASVANGLGPAALARMLVEDDSTEVFDPGVLLRPAFGEYLRRALSVPVLFWSSLAAVSRRPLACSSARGFPGPQPCHSDRRFQQRRNR
jgi:NTE family protein